MGRTAQSIGAQAESRAAEYLVRHGLRLMQRNFRCRGGEIDLILRDGQVLVFVEVRARAASGYGSAAESITAAKRTRIILAARHYLAQHELDLPCRFDAVLLDGEALNWIRNAFGA